MISATTLPCKRLPVVPLASRALKLLHLSGNARALTVRSGMNFCQVPDGLDALAEVMQVAFFEHWELRAHLIEVSHKFGGNAFCLNQRQIVPCNFQLFFCLTETMFLLLDRCDKRFRCAATILCEPVFQTIRPLEALLHGPWRVFAGLIQRGTKFVKLTDPDIDFSNRAESLTKLFSLLAKAEHRLSLVACVRQFREIALQLRLQAQRDDPQCMHPLARRFTVTAIQQICPRGQAILQSCATLSSFFWGIHLTL